MDVGIMCACMPSFRVILLRIFPRLGSTHEASNHQATTGNKSYAEVSRSDNIKSGISYSKNYTVEYATKPAHDESSFVQLVEIRAAPEESIDNISQHEE